MNLSELKNMSLQFDRAVVKDVTVEGQTEPEKRFRAIWNNDKQKVATIASDRYKLVQHQVVINSVVDALMNLNIKSEAKVMDAGNRIFVDINFTDTKIKLTNIGEEFIAGVRVINSYDKTTGIMCLPLLKRLVCSNGMVMNVWVKGYSIIHTQNLARDFESVVQTMIAKMIESNERLKQMVSECIADSVEWKIMKSILGSLLPQEKHVEAIMKILEERKLKKITRWDLYNAFTTYATHGEQLKPAVEQRIQNRAQVVLTTPIAELTPKRNIQ